MSNFQLPTQKGTGPKFDQVIQAPCKLAIVGTGGDPALDAKVINEYHGNLRQFHAKQQQGYSLSENPSQRGHADFGDATAVYTNTYGQESMVLHVSPEAVERIKRQNDNLAYWDWALVELHVPAVTTGDIDTYIAAFLVDKYKGQLVWARANYSSNSPDKILQFADTQEASHDTRDPKIIIYDAGDGNPIIDSPDVCYSLLVDLRKFQTPGKVVLIDIYGFVYAPEDFSSMYLDAQATLNVALFKGKPIDAISDHLTTVGHVGEYSDNEPYTLWESSKLFPQRPRMGTAPDKLTIPAQEYPGTDDPNVFFGYHKIGTLKLGITDDNVGFNFKPV